MYKSFKKNQISCNQFKTIAFYDYTNNTHLNLLNMKKLTLNLAILIASATFTFVSCQKEDLSDDGRLKVPDNTTIVTRDSSNFNSNNTDSSNVNQRDTNTVQINSDTLRGSNSSAQNMVTRDSSNHLNKVDYYNEEFCTFVNFEKYDNIGLIIDNYLSGKKSNFTDTEKLEKLRDWLKSISCVSDAEIICNSCIKTNPPKSELKISFNVKGQKVERFITVIMGEELQFDRIYQ